MKGYAWYELEAAMKVTFRGVRGSFPVTQPPGSRYGGNTPCLEVDTGNSLILIDAGTGIRGVGNSLVEKGIDKIHLLLSHTHWDHIQGFPHFAPLYEPGVQVHLYSLGRRDRSLKEVLSGQQNRDFFPVSLNDIKAEVSFTDLKDGTRFAIGDTQVLCRRLNHPGVAGGFRLEQNGSSMSYISDVDDGTDLLLGEDMPASNGAERVQNWRH